MPVTGAALVGHTCRGLFALLRYRLILGSRDVLASRFVVLQPFEGLI
jgi:hypothetical protein